MGRDVRRGVGGERGGGTCFGHLEHYSFIHDSTNEILRFYYQKRRQSPPTLPPETIPDTTSIPPPQPQLLRSTQLLTETPHTVSLEPRSSPLAPHRVAHAWSDRVHNPRVMHIVYRSRHSRRKRELSLVLKTVLHLRGVHGVGGGG